MTDTKTNIHTQTSIANIYFSWPSRGKVFEYVYLWGADKEKRSISGDLDFYHGSSNTDDV